MLFDQMQCDKCHHSIPVTDAQVVSLCSVYKARLCAHCMNDWEVFIRGTQLYLSVQAAEDRINMLLAMSHFDGEDRIEDIQGYRNSQLTARIGLYNEAEAWVRRRDE